MRSTLLYIIYNSKDAISTQEVVSDENLEAQGDLLTSEWLVNLKALP